MSIPPPGLQKFVIV